MKSLHIFLVLSVLVFLSGLAVSAQTPREIVDQCITTLGGEEGVRNFSNYKAEGEIGFSFGPRTFTGEITMIQKGRKSRMKGEFDFRGTVMTIIRAFDGKNAWADRLGTIVDQPALNYQSDLDHTPLVLLEKEASFSLTRQTEIEGKKAIGIEVTFNNKKTTFFIDQTDHTLREIRYRDLFFGDSYNKETLEKRIRCLDYKKIKGFMFPSRMIHYLKGKKRLELNFREIMFDPKVTPDMFERPDQELDLRTREEIYH
ncbi:MAG: hypothetical protein JSV88_29900 [Candidatus Aminicenantes bacterium]|nr:MAG: hypothetical protein JSV88_29900 [Candidatus Aminicenantes bacterium]